MALIDVLDPHDVVLAEITPGLNLDQLEWDLALVGQAMDRANRNVDRLVLVHGFDLRSDGDLRGAAYHHPVFGPMMVLLQRQGAAGPHHDAFDLEPLALID